MVYGVSGWVCATFLHHRPQISCWADVSNRPDAPMNTGEGLTRSALPMLLPTVGERAEACFTRGIPDGYEFAIGR
jgi:hypothetical protein